MVLVNLPALQWGSPRWAISTFLLDVAYTGRLYRGALWVHCPYLQKGKPVRVLSSGKLYLLCMGARRV